MASLVGAILFLRPITLPISHFHFPLPISQSPFPNPHFPIPIFHFHLPLPRLLPSACFPLAATLCRLSSGCACALRPASAIPVPGSSPARTASRWSSAAIPRPETAPPQRPAQQQTSSGGEKYSGLASNLEHLGRMRLSPGRRCSSCNSSRARILVIGTYGVHWCARFTMPLLSFPTPRKASVISNFESPNFRKVNSPF